MDVNQILEREFMDFQNEYSEFVKRGLEIKAVENKLLSMIKLIVTLGDEIRLYNDFGRVGLCLFNETEIRLLTTRQFIIADMMADAREEITKAVKISREKNKLYLQDFDKDEQLNSLFTCERLLNKSRNKVVRMVLRKINRIK